MSMVKLLLNKTRQQAVSQIEMLEKHIANTNEVLSTYQHEIDKYRSEIKEIDESLAKLEGTTHATENKKAVRKGRNSN